MTVLLRRMICTPSASFSARKNPQRIPANTPPVFPGLWPRIWPHLLRLVTKAMSDGLQETATVWVHCPLCLDEVMFSRANGGAVMRCSSAEWSWPRLHWCRLEYVMFKLKS